MEEVTTGATPALSMEAPGSWTVVGLIGGGIWYYETHYAHPDGFAP